MCKPNDWSRTISNAARAIEHEDLSGAKKIQLEYWTAFREYLQQNSKIIRPQKPQPQHWMTFAVGRSNFQLVTTTNTRDTRIGVSLSINGINSKSHFNLLYAEKDQIEEEFGETLQWLELPDKIESRIQVEKNSDPTNKPTWEDQHKWLCERLESLHRVFQRRVKELGI